MSEYTREMIGNCRRWIKDLTDDSVNETLCADEFAGLLDDALDEIERQQARIAELEAEVTKCHELQDSYCDHIAELEAVQRWIPASEWLPVGGKVLVLWKDRTIHLDWTFIDGGRYYWWNSGDNVTHWMPLPELPKERDE